MVGLAESLTLLGLDSVKWHDSIVGDLIRLFSPAQLDVDSVATLSTTRWTADYPPLNSRATIPDAIYQASSCGISASCTRGRGPFGGS